MKIIIDSMYMCIYIIYGTSKGRKTIDQWLVYSIISDHTSQSQSTLVQHGESKNNGSSCYHTTEEGGGRHDTTTVIEFHCITIDIFFSDHLAIQNIIRQGYSGDIQLLQVRHHTIAVRFRIRNTRSVVGHIHCHSLPRTSLIVSFHLTGE